MRGPRVRMATIHSVPRAGEAVDGLWIVGEFLRIAGPKQKVFPPLGPGCGQGCENRAKSIRAMSKGKISQWQMRVAPGAGPRHGPGAAPWIALVALLVAAASAGCGTSEPTPGAVSGTGVPGTPGEPGRQRLVTLTPSATEVVDALGATALLVGVDDYTTYPEAVKGLPRVGTFLAPNVESILRLRPTLVIVDDVQAGVGSALRELGIATVECPMHTLADVRTSLTRVGARIGRADQARDVVAGIDAAIAAVTARRHGGPRPRVLVVIDREPTGLGTLVAGGPGSWHDELLALVGADNALAAAPSRYPKLSLEEVLRAAPDAIVDTTFGADPARAAIDWAPAARVPAVANRRIAVVKEPYFIAPSPRVATALTELEAIVHPPGFGPAAREPAPAAGP
jgi:iron complex transport system substrate-binding protein